MEKKNKDRRFPAWVRPVVIMAVLLFLLDYAECPAWNIHSTGFWVMWIVVLFVGVVASLPGGFLSGYVRIMKPARRRNREGIVEPEEPERKKEAPRKGGIGKILLIALPAVLVLFFLAGVFSGEFFHARAYSQILTVEEGSREDIPSAEGTASIALMDTASASMLGDREIGSLSDVVSQYDISSYDYVQINDQGRPLKVAPLSYAGFFKWYANRKNGVPGYVTVDPVSMSASYVRCETGMTYVPSAFLGEDLYRHIRRGYKTTLFMEPHFEIDDDGKPWFVAPTYEESIFIFGGTRVTGAILIDPVTGAMEKMAAAEVPEWVDVVYPGDLICTQYNNYAQLQRGYINSVIGQNGCRRVTTRSGGDDEADEADYGYVAKGTDIWIYTGVTSVNGDSSNIGFIMSNERTGQTRFISCSGADEFSAMAAAEGEVQEKRYQASFPSLILVDGMPTYIMVLKDYAGLVKMYACVNVEQYNIVATSTRQKDCIARYKALMAGDISMEEAVSDTGLSGMEEDLNTEDWETRTITIRKMTGIDRGGNTYLYVADEKGTIYHALYSDVIGMMLMEEGDEVTILTDGEHFLLQEN